jgi:hypothetical protein
MKHISQNILCDLVYIITMSIDMKVHIDIGDVDTNIIFFSI